MNALRLSPWLSPSLIVATVASLAAALVFAYASGCAGDLKAGTWGDTQRALAFDDDFGLALLLALPLGWLAVITRSRPRASAWLGAGLTVAAVFATWMLGWQFGTWGATACFPH